MVYAVIGYDEDWYTFETFMGVFSTKEKAQMIIDNDYDVYGDEKIMNHQEYRIYPIAIDEEFKVTEEIFPYEEDEEQKGEIKMDLEEILEVLLEDCDIDDITIEDYGDFLIIEA